MLAHAPSTSRRISAYRSIDLAHEGVHVSRVLFAVHEPQTRRGANMSVLVRLSVSGMTTDSYDKVS